MIPDSGQETAEHRQDFRESLKLVYDAFKHVTTLSTGSLVLLSTLLQRFIQAPKHMWLLSLTFIDLTVTLVSSLFMMIAVSAIMAKPKYVLSQAFAAFAFYGTLFFFILGIVSLALFALINLH